MNREEKVVMLKLDVIFKRVFGNDSNKDIILWRFSRARRFRR